MRTAPSASSSLALVSLLVTACAGGPGDATIDITHDACAPLAVVAPGATDAQRAAIDAALALWHDRGAPAITHAPASAAPADALVIQFERAAPAFYGLYDDEAGVIYVNTDLASPAALAIVLAHEVGHAFGLPHVTERASLMNPGNLALPPTAEDEAALAALWGACAAPPAAIAAPLAGVPVAR